MFTVFFCFAVGVSHRRVSFLAAMNTRLAGHVVETVTAISETDCGRLCLESETCR